MENAFYRCAVTSLILFRESKFNVVRGFMVIQNGQNSYFVFLRRIEHSYLSDGQFPYLTALISHPLINRTYQREVSQLAYVPL